MIYVNPWGRRCEELRASWRRAFVFCCNLFVQCPAEKTPFHENEIPRWTNPSSPPSPFWSARPQGRSVARSSGGKMGNTIVMRSSFQWRFHSCNGLEDNIYNLSLSMYIDHHIWIVYNVPTTRVSLMRSCSARATLTPHNSFSSSSRTWDDGFCCSRVGQLALLLMAKCFVTRSENGRKILLFNSVLLSITSWNVFKGMFCSRVVAAAAKGKGISVGSRSVF